MDAMIASPVVDGSLVRDGVAQHEEETDGEGSGVRAVRPKTVHADGDAEATVDDERAIESGRGVRWSVCQYCNLFSRM